MSKHTLDRSIKEKTFPNGMIFTVGQEVEIQVYGENRGIGIIDGFRKGKIHEDIILVKKTTKKGSWNFYNYYYTFLFPKVLPLPPSPKVDGIRKD
jgi:hypothetical protein